MGDFKKQLGFQLGVSLPIIAALLAGVFFFGGKISAYTQKIVYDKATLNGRSNTVKQLADLETQYNNQAKSDMNVLYNVIPSYDELINLNSDFQSLAAQNKVDYGFSFAGETPKSGSGLGYVSFNINSSASELDPLLSFLKSLQNFRYLSSIDNVSLKEDGGEITMAVNGRVFYH